MFGYHLRDVDIFAAKGHPICASFLAAGPWQFRVSPLGGTLAAAVGAPSDQKYGAPIPCDDVPGLSFLPPLNPVEPAQLARIAATQPDCTSVHLGSGHTIAILPAYLEPRRVLSRGRIGDPATQYGILARDVLTKWTGDGETFNLLDPAVVSLLYSALAITYRVTPHFLDWAGWLTTADLEPALVAVMKGPKAEPVSEPLPCALPLAGFTPSPSPR